MRRPLLIQGLVGYIASSFFNFISRACFSRKVLIKFKSITREASRFLWFDFKVSCQSTCRSLLKVSYLNTLRFLLNCLLSFLVLCDLISGTGLVKLSTITFWSVLLSKILSIRVIARVVNPVGMVILGARDVWWHFVRKFLDW